MATLNYAFKEISCKIVYYGCGLCGKTTNLIHVHKTVPNKFRGELVSLATEQDRTLFFDFLPLDLGEVKGFKTKFQLYTVPGQVYYNATRKLVLRGVDGIVFVADSQRDRLQENVESFENLSQNLTEYGYTLRQNKEDMEGIPWILQLNKRDMPQISTGEEIIEAMGIDPSTPTVDAVAVNGVGVKETLKGISSLVIQRLDSGGGSLGAKSAAASSKTAEPAKPAAPAPAAPAATAPPEAEDDEYGEMTEEELSDEKLEAAPKAAKPAEAKPAAPAAEPAPAGGLPSPPEGADAGKPPEPEQPELTVSQSCAARWRGSKTGGGELTLSNMAGSEDYQITGSLGYMGLFKRSISQKLVYKGEVSRTLDGELANYLEFATAEDSTSPKLEVLVEHTVEKRMYVRYSGFAGEIVASPTDKKGWPS